MPRESFLRESGAPPGGKTTDKTLEFLFLYVDARFLFLPFTVKTLQFEILYVEQTMKFKKEHKELICGDRFLIKTLRIRIMKGSFLYVSGFYPVLQAYV